jgi:hypothetical protein
MQKAFRTYLVVFYSFITLCGSVGIALAASTVNPLPGQWRGLHLLNYQSDSALKGLEEVIPALAEMGVNVLILEVNYGFTYQSHPELRMGSSPITREGACSLVKTCRAHGMRLIPQFSCFGHQSWAKKTFSLLTTYPELDLTPGAFPENEGIYCREWDPYQPKVYEIVFSLLDELIDAFDADAMHVGMDEVFLIGSEHAPSTKDKDPAEVFAKAVNDLHGHLVKKRGIEMLMWADRFIDAKVIKYGKWEASMNGTAPALDKVPKDIIMCDWHYELRETYPSVPMFLEEGFRVWPAGWKKVDATKALIQYSRAYAGSRFCQKTSSLARERAVFSAGKDGEAGDVCSIVDAAGCSQAEKGPLEARSSFLTEPSMLGHLFTTWSGPKKWTEFPPLVEGLKLLQPSNESVDK